MKKSRIIIIGFLILLVVVLIFAMPTLGKLLKINANDVQKIEISQDIYYLDDDSEALWTTVTDSKDISKLVKALNRPFTRKGYEPTEGGSRRKVVFFLTNGENVELYLLQDRGFSFNGEQYSFLFSFGGHRKVVYDDIDRLLEQYEFSKGIPGEPVPPSDDVLAEYLGSMISAGRIDEEMYISQAYLLTDAETDSYCNFWYFVFENDEIQAVLNLSLTPDDEGHYANGNHLIDGGETITACFRRILEENLSFGLISTGGEYPLTVLCAEDCSETVLYPVNERGNIDIEDTDEMFSLNCFERKNLELRKVSDILNISESGTEDFEQPYGHQGNMEGFTDWRIEPEDRVVEFSPEDLWDTDLGEFKAPGLVLGCDKEIVLQHYGIETLEGFPPTDPEMWFYMNVDDVDCVFVPEFTFGSSNRTCSMYIKQRISNNLEQQSEAIATALINAFGEPRMETLTGEMIGLDDKYSLINHEWKIEDGTSILRLYITKHLGHVTEIQVLIYKKIS